MSERQDTIVCSFDSKILRMSVFDVHEWIHDTMRLTEADVAMVQVDGAKRQVKLREFNKMQEIFASTRGSGEVRHMTEEISTVRTDAAGLCTKRVRLENMPPEELRGILRLPSGREMAADMKGVWLLNVYVPSGAGKIQELEEVFSIRKYHTSCDRPRHA
jgi:hypothetical protein